MGRVHKERCVCMCGVCVCVCVSTARDYCPVSLLSVVTKVFEKRVNNRIVDNLEKCGLFF